MLYGKTTFKSFCFILAFAYAVKTSAQALRIPQNTNFGCSVGRQLGTTDIEIKWHSPGVKGHESKIWGTDIAPYGFTVLGFGSNVVSAWRAGADESTTISFSTDVKINGKPLSAGKYGFLLLYILILAHPFSIKIPLVGAVIFTELTWT